jgi:hypothetical protein
VGPDVLGRYHAGVSPTFRAAPVLAYLLGAWRVDRRLTDFAGAGTGTFTGRASWTPAGSEAAQTGAGETGAALAYREDGELVWRGRAGPAYRELLYVAGPDGTADVRFADGRPFYRLDPRDGRWTAAHDCGPDRYEVTGELTGPDTLTEHWHARGPDTDYELVTVLTRLPG